MEKFAEHGWDTIKQPQGMNEKHVIVDKVFTLIKSLNKSEKGYFKKMASALSQNSNNNYMLLYDELDKMKVYDEKILKQKLFKHPSIIKQLHVLKHYLYHLILKALRLYYENSKIESKIFNEIENAEILSKKKLYNLSVLHAQKSKKIAEDLSYSTNIFLANFYIRRNILNNIDENWIESLDENIKEARIIANKTLINIEIEYIYARFIHFYRTAGLTRKDDQKNILKSLFEKLASFEINVNALTVLEKIQYYLIHKFYYEHEENNEKSFEYMEKVLQLYDDNIAIRDSKLQNYVNAINNLCSIAIKCKKFDYTLQLLNRIDKEVLQYDKEHDYKMYEFFVELNLKAKNYEAVKRLTQDLKENIGKSIKIFSTERLILLKYNLIILNYILGNLDEAIGFCIELKNIKQTEVRQNILIGTKMFLCILYYKTHNFELLESEIRSAKYFMQSRDRYYEIESLVLNLYAKLLKCKNKSEKLEVFELIKEEIESLTSTNQYEKNFLNVCDVTIWLESEIQNLTPLQVVESRFLIS